MLCQVAGAEAQASQRSEALRAKRNDREAARTCAGELRNAVRRLRETVEEDYALQGEEEE